SGERHQASANTLVRLEGGDVLAGEAHDAAARQQHAREDAEQRRLAGAVRPEQTDALAVADGDTDVEEHLERAVREVDALGFEQRARHRRNPKPTKTIVSTRASAIVHRWPSVRSA